MPKHFFLLSKNPITFLKLFEQLFYILMVDIFEKSHSFYSFICQRNPNIFSSGSWIKNYCCLRVLLRVWTPTWLLNWFEQLIKVLMRDTFKKSVYSVCRLYWLFTDEIHNFSYTSWVKYSCWVTVYLSRRTLGLRFRRSEQRLEPLEKSNF